MAGRPSLNKLRLSNLKYFIIRPGRLLSKTSASCNVLISQADNVRGSISRKNLALTVLASLKDKKINLDKVTFEVIEGKTSEALTLVLKCDHLLLDNEDNIIKVDHFRVTRNFKGI
jgi:hypothetical protein